MSVYFTLNDVRTAATEALRRRTLPAAQLLAYDSHTTNDADRFDVFLSHSMKDAELVYGIKVLLEATGITVYVDWIVDPKLDRNAVAPATARVLRKRMDQCATLVYVASVNAPASKWMPWELGYFDGKKGESLVAILPLVNHQGETFPGQEYLGLYPSVERAEVGALRDVYIKSAGKVGYFRNFAKSGRHLTTF